MNSNNNNNILEARKLCKSYGEFKLKDVSFNLPRGYIMGFVGPNGAGKTTTIKALMKAIKLDSGSVKLFGQEDEEDRQDARENIGVVMDAPLYADDWTINDVEKALSPFYKSWDKKTFADLTKRFELDGKKKVKELSRGMKVKLQIAVALSQGANLLILDEPTSGLDPVARDEICDLLREFISDEKKGVLFSTHITSDLERTADYITFILNGEIAFTGATNALLEKYARITGGLDVLTGELKSLIIGEREHQTGFEGMVESANIDKLPSGVLTEEISLDEIIIFMNKGAKLHE